MKTGCFECWINYFKLSPWEKTTHRLNFQLHCQSVGSLLKCLNIMKIPKWVNSFFLFISNPENRDFAFHSALLFSHQNRNVVDSDGCQRQCCRHFHSKSSTWKIVNWYHCHCCPVGYRVYSLLKNDKNLWNSSREIRDLWLTHFSSLFSVLLDMIVKWFGLNNCSVSALRSFGWSL